MNSINDREFSDCLDNLSKINNRKNIQIKYLKERAMTLKSEAFKDEELKKMKAVLGKMQDEYRRGFPISEEEDIKINEWIEKHLKEKHYDKKRNCYKMCGTIGGHFTYEFLPTGIGTIGKIRCSCGEEFTFHNFE